MRCTEMRPEVLAAAQEQQGKREPRKKEEKEERKREERKEEDDDGGEGLTSSRGGVFGRKLRGIGPIGRSARALGTKVATARRLFPVGAIAAASKNGHLLLQNSLPHQCISILYGFLGAGSLNCVADLDDLGMDVFCK